MKKLILNSRYCGYLVVLMTISSLIAIVPDAHAARHRDENAFPLGCRAQGFEFMGDSINFKPDYTGKKWEQTLYFLHNTSDKDVELEVRKPRGQKFGPNYKNTIKANGWGVFALDYNQFELTCNEKSYAGDVYSGNCADFFKICEYNNAKFAPHNRGTYWTVQSGSRAEATRGAIKNGILLRS